MAVNELLSVVLSGGGRRDTSKPTCSTTCETLGYHNLIPVIFWELPPPKPYFGNMLEHLLRDGDQPHPPPKPPFIKFLEHFQGGRGAWFQERTTDLSRLQHSHNDTNQIMVTLFICSLAHLTGSQ